MFEGIVSLVGAGPGDPGLMTARALERISEADVIFYDRLIPPGALSGAQEEAELVYVGKVPGQPQNSQEEINQRLIAAAREGRNVVRLKGGDPLIFGRGGEEAEELAKAGIAFEIVPGVTAAIAGTATAGIPLTHRDDATGVAFVTGHRGAGVEQGLDPEGALARFPGTLVIYMGVKRLAENVQELIDGGRPADQPAAAIEWGSTPRQRVVTATLGTIAEAVEREGIKAPAVIVVGDVVRHREQLAWFENRPLFGRTVVVTRAKHQAGRLSAILRSLGAEVVEMPVIDIEALPMTDDAISDGLEVLLDHQDGVACFTSPNAVRFFFLLLFAALQGDARKLNGWKVAAIGRSTAEELASYGINADIVPDRAVSESLLETLASHDLKGRQVLIPRAEAARDLLPDGLRELGAEVSVMPLYRTVPVQPEAEVLQAAREADAITFTSASTVKNLVAAVPEGLPGLAHVSIGPITSKAMRAAGMEVTLEAERSDLSGLASAVAETLQS